MLLSCLQSTKQQDRPFFDGCIGALDGTHVKVKVNKEAKIDHINRKGDVSINVCAIVDIDGRFTYVSVGMVGFGA